MQTWLDLFEETRKPYLEEAREIARNLLKIKDWITVDDVRKVCPPPSNIDGRVLGAVFSTEEFESIGWVKGGRKESHHRPINRFRLKIRRNP